MEYLRESIRAQFNSISQKQVYNYNYNFDKIDREERIRMGKDMRKRYPHRAPVIINQVRDMPPPDRFKYLLPFDISVGEFIHVLRKRMNLPPDRAIFLSINNHIPSIQQTIGELYHSHPTEDNFLLITIQSESAFG